MRRSDLAIWIASAVVVVAAVVVLVFMVVPLEARLDAALSEALVAEERLAHLGAAAVDDDFERELRIFAEKRAAKAADVELARARLASLLDAPFPGMKVLPGATQPTSDEFQRAYNFSGDQLKSRIRDFVARSGGPPIEVVPLIAPQFSAMAEIDPATMKRLQRFANIEARLLETAAKSGAYPASVVRIEEEPPSSEDADGGYERVRIGLDLFCREGQPGPMIHALLPCFDVMGGIMRLVGMIESPVSEQRLREHPEIAEKRVFLTLSLGFPTPIGDAP